MAHDIGKIMGLVDARGPQGVFSRGKPVYRGGSNSPKAGPAKNKALQRAAKKKLSNKGYAR